MARSNGTSKMARNAGTLAALLGLLAFFASVFSLVSRPFLIIGIALIVISLVAYFIEESVERRASS
jgi:hypothetical protein